ncbi:MAG TPA: archease [Candidatus Binatia bacterium]|nr:archease [Candidatus Binatia bacterium]
MSSKKGFRILDNLVMADTAFEATGKDLNELFEHAGLAVESIMAESVKKVITKDVSLEKDTVENLLYAFLSELVYLKDAEQLLFSDIKASASKNSGWALHAHLRGETIHPKMKLGTDVKAITLHQYEVKKGKDGWKATVVVDV